VPAGVETFRVIIVHQHGCGAAYVGPNMPYDLWWQSLTKKWHGILIAPAQSIDQDTCPWADSSSGSEQNFLTALDRIAAKTGHAEIKRIPWVLWGHSAGSWWSFELACKSPERVAALVLNAYAPEVPEGCNDGIVKIPTLHHQGKQDLGTNDVAFSTLRARGGLQAHAINPLAVHGALDGHGVRDLRFLAIPWIDIALSYRLGTPGQAQLQDMPVANMEVWLGDRDSISIAKESQYLGNPLQASWFPNFTLAQAWQDYMKTGHVTDRSPANSGPFNVQASFEPDGVHLNWDCDADIESGMFTFRVYRNGQVLEELTYEKGIDHWNNPLGAYQAWGYGDDPVPKLPPAMAYVDQTATTTGSYQYEITMLNFAKLESPKSAKVLVDKGQIKGVANPRRHWGCFLLHQ
jgi:pimeloyl-ACP methyl ester carboxylesterase